MSLVTLEVLEGLERGRTYKDLPTPVTIGREDDNSIRLNDERISRFHAKIQEDAGRLILTDLDSTNGTRVNGHPVQIKVLQPGDVLHLGRCVLRFGRQEEIKSRMSVHRNAAGEIDCTLPSIAEGSSGEFDEDTAELFPEGPPATPGHLSLQQRAELSDILAYLHDRIRRVISTGVEDDETDEDSQQMLVDWPAWQELIDVELEIARYLKRIAEPEA